MITIVPPAIPDSIKRLATGRPLRPVWRNEIGGLTFEAMGADRVFIKWSPVSLDEEVDRLEWAAAFTPVPRVLDHGTDDDGWWLVTAPIPGENAVTARWRSSPRTAVTAIGEGLRALHDALPVASCPFSWSVADRLGRGVHRDPAGWHPEHRQLSADEALAIVSRPPPSNDLVVCHGDACAPNTIIGADGRWSGHVDLGRLGVADRWADIAVATWSTEWNYGPGWEATLLAAYGTAPDPERTRYYRLLWDLTD
jgi:kanamycin kinase